MKVVRRLKLILLFGFAWFIFFLIYLNVEQFLEKLFNLNSNNVSHHQTDYLVGTKVAAQLKLATKDDFHYYTKKEKAKTFLNGNSDYALVRNMEDQFIRDIGYKRYAFNALVSNNIGISRTIPDTRHKVCTNKSTPSHLPKVSIIMCFYNEHLETLLRSINSILERTPSDILKEIIIIDDYSDYEELQTELAQRLSDIDQNNVTILLRNNEREGLIRARIVGSRHATGEVLVFLDSHIEVNTNWLPPLLEVIQKEYSTLAVPVIDIINADTFSYTPSPLVRGGFNWGLHFKWEDLPEGTLVNESSFSGPFLSPTMAGGLFAVNKEYFKEIGEYDEGMDIWGAENLEISFRVWQCGGSIKILPCSRVGHVFRKRRPYSSPKGTNTFLRNSLRLAYVWMDDYKDLFLRNHKEAKDFNFGDISDRILLRQKLKCKPFSWYIKHIYPEIELPLDGSKRGISFQPWQSRKRKYVNNYLLRLENTTLCLSVSTKKNLKSWKRGSTLILRPCARDKAQIWYETDKSELILDKSYCLEAFTSEKSSYPVIGKCHEMFGDQEWRHKKGNSTPIYNAATGTCLKAPNAVVGAPIFLDICSLKTLNSWDLI